MNNKSNLLLCGVLLAAMLGLSACSSVVPSNFSTLTSSQKGTVVFSTQVTGTAAPIVAQHGMAIYYNKADANATAANKSLQLQANNSPYYNVYLLELPKGNYAFNGCAYYLPTLNQMFAGNQYNYNCPPNSTVYFSVIPGKVTYIGSINYQIDDRRGALAYSNNPKLQVKVNNQTARDLIVIKQQWPQVTIKKVKTQLATRPMALQAS